MSITVPPSIGVTMFSGNLRSSEELLKQADIAMYQSKTDGRNTLRFFDPEMQEIVTQRASLETDLREALEQRQFVVYYQPQVVGDGRYTGAEALVRWRHPQRGLVSPQDFIPLCEETGLILPLGHWVLETACMQLAKWAEKPGMDHLSIAVNVSANQFHQANFVDQVLAVLRNAGANPHKLTLELTESILVSDVENIIAKMSILKGHGVTFSLDDFGTGYSSLSYLKRLPLDQLKIDQSFVRNILTEPNDAAIAKTIISLSDSLSLRVIAEGGEIDAQKDFLARYGCHAFQGYLFSKPVPIEKFEQLLKSRHT
ncbi:MAG: GGDEF domain-containing phosphodiesterase [Methylococcaceae bacterium]|nr:GGDEF domain-containing phosphodiesterase [Methylococcaceae bacterium]